MPSIRTLSSAFVLALLVACGGGTDGDPDGQGDAGLDGGSGDAAVDTDAAPDAVDDADGGDDAADVDDELDTGGDVGADADATDAGSDAADAGPDDADGGSDDADDDAPDAPEDVGPDIAPELCGNNRLDPGEECDDGNLVDTDLCTNACREAVCGDGIRNETIGIETFTSPLVTNPGGVEAYACDDGATCPGQSCSVENEPTAPEHGICQSLGYDRAINVTWGGGLGDGGSRMVHAYNWTCFDYLCVASDDDGTASDCASWEMLATIECEGLIGEACDDGSANGPFPDACREDCSLPFCGDGVTDRDEECDDGNDVDDDGCRTDCTLPYCGDGRPNEGEACDDGNDDDLDACRNNCSLPVCGDGVVSAYERTEVFTSPTVTNPFGASGHVCDNGSSCPGRSCDLTASGGAPEHGICQSLGFERAVFASWGGGAGENDDPMPRAANWACSGFECGPGPDSASNDICNSSEMLLTLICMTTQGEQCDEGEDNSNDVGAACRRDCLLPACGDGVVEGDEVCDDGNRNDNDGCTNACELPRCGDGIAQGGEECDDGDLDDFDRCRNDCTRPVCGDGVLSEGEACDDGDGNSELPDAVCRTDCTPAGCGDGVVDSVEECDPAVDPVNDFCTPECLFGRCGDGIRQRSLGEQCDDGNRLDGDGCDRVCLRESGGGGGYAIYLGHDFFSVNDDISNAIGNAVFGDGAPSPVRVLGYEQYADRSSGGEVNNVNAALDAEAAARGYEWERTALTDSNQLGDLIDEADVLLVYEQESGSSQMISVGASWAELLVDFLERGGRLIVTDYSGSTWRLLSGAGISDVASARTLSAGISLEIADETSFILDGANLPYTSSNGTIALQVSEDDAMYSVVYSGSETTPVVWVRPY